jgi:hypothetical protein
LQLYKQVHGVQMAGGGDVHGAESAVLLAITTHAGFSTTAAEVLVLVGASPCSVTASTPTSVTCTTGPMASNMTADVAANISVDASLVSMLAADVLVYHAAAHAAPDEA